MSKAKYGLLSGLGQGVAQAGSMMFAVAADKEKQKWQEEYQAKMQKEQNDRQDLLISEANTRDDTIRQQDRANLLSDRQSLIDSQKNRYTQETDENGDTWEVDTQTGQRSLVAERGKASDIYGVVGDDLYNKFTGARISSGNGSSITSAQVGAARAITETLGEKIANGEELTSQEKERYDNAMNFLGAGLGFDSEDASISTSGDRPSIDDLVFGSPNPDAQTMPEPLTEDDPEFMGPYSKYSERAIDEVPRAGLLIGINLPSADDKIDAIERLVAGQESSLGVIPGVTISNAQRDLLRFINDPSASDQTKQRAKALFDQLNAKK